MDAIPNPADRIRQFDPEMAALLDGEQERQRRTLSLIPSENVSSPYAKSLEGSLFADKNAEGYPGQRVVAGCEQADAVERLAIDRLRQLFDCEHANVQSMSATIANVALLNAVLEPGDTILAMSLSDGGHLSHGAPFHVSGQTYEAVHYTVDRKTERIDHDAVADLARRHRPKLIICGASSYPRLIDYAAFADIAKSVDALLWADIAHVVGLIAGKSVPSPLPHADFVTTSTHKSWRGPRGAGIILCREEWAKRIDRAVFPGLQGAPKMDMIAARAVFFKECLSPSFQTYTRAVLNNAQALAEGLIENGIRLVTGGTDTHLLLADVSALGLNGAEAQDLLSSVGLMTNRNPIPFDTQPAMVGSGIRLGSPAITTRGLTEDNCREIGQLVASTLIRWSSPEDLARITSRVTELTDNLPMFDTKWLPNA